MEPHQVDILALPMLGDFQQIDDPQKSRLPRQLRSNFLEPDLLNGIDLNLAFLHPVAVPDNDVRALPYPDTARDLSLADAVAKSLRERHEESLGFRLRIAGGRSL